MYKLQHWEDSIPYLIEKREKYKTFLNLGTEIDRDFKNNDFFIKVKAKKIKLSQKIKSLNCKIMVYKKRY